MDIFARSTSDVFNWIGHGWSVQQIHLKTRDFFYHEVGCPGKDDDAEEGPKDALSGKLVPLKEPALEALP